MQTNNFRLFSIVILTSLLIGSCAPNNTRISTAGDAASTQNALRLSSSNPTEALKNLNEILMKDPDYYLALIARVLIYEKIKDYQNAEKDLQKLILLEVTDDTRSTIALANSMLGEIKFKHGDSIENVEKLFYKSFDICPDGKAYGRLASIYNDLGDNKKCTEMREKAITTYKRQIDNRKLCDGDMSTINENQLKLIKSMLAMAMGILGEREGLDALMKLVSEYPEDGPKYTYQMAILSFKYPDRFEEINAFIRGKLNEDPENIYYLLALLRIHDNLLYNNINLFGQFKDTIFEIADKLIIIAGNSQLMNKYRADSKSIVPGYTPFDHDLIVAFIGVINKCLVGKEYDRCMNYSNYIINAPKLLVDKEEYFSIYANSGSCAEQVGDKCLANKYYKEATKLYHGLSQKEKTRYGQAFTNMILFGDKFHTECQEGN